MNVATAQSWLERAAALGRFIETALIVALLCGLTLFASAEIFMRDVFSIGVIWGDELVRIAVLWLALLGAMAAARDNQHITMGALIRWMPPAWQRVCEVCADLFAALFSGGFAWVAWRFVSQSRAFGDTALNGLPAWCVQVIMPIAFALIAYSYLARAALRAIGR